MTTESSNSRKTAGTRRSILKAGSALAGATLALTLHVAPMLLRPEAVSF